MNPKVTNPRVTVLMPVFNGEKYLKEAIDSILRQTFKDFEFLIINDGSTDRSEEIIRQYKDSRIKLVNNPENMGIEASLNLGIDLAKGEYIARMDADDISMPKRLATQVKFLDKNKMTGACGTWIERFETGSDDEGDIFQYPTEYNEIKCKLFFFNCIAHSTVMFRKSLIVEHKLYYNSEFKLAEDFDFWQRCSSHFKLVNIPDVLLKYRLKGCLNGGGTADNEVLRETLIKIDKKNFALLGLEPDSAKLALHQEICPQRLPQMPTGLNFAFRVERWLQEILAANEEKQLYPQPDFAEILAERWYTVCSKNVEHGLHTWDLYFQSSLKDHACLPFGSMFKFTIKCVINEIRNEKNECKPL